VPQGLGCSLGEALLTPTKIYVKSLLSVIENIGIHAVSHITGGGFYENIPRMLPEGLCAKVEKGSFETPAIFKLMEERAGLSERDLFNTFNMGIGLVLAVDKQKADQVVNHLATLGEKAWVIGEVQKGEAGVTLL